MMIGLPNPLLTIPALIADAIWQRFKRWRWEAKLDASGPTRALRTFWPALTAPKEGTPQDGW